MALRPLTIVSEGRRLFGVLEAPAEARAGVVLVHGWGGCRMGPHRILVDAARELVRRGFATLRFDLGGRGESEGDPMAVDLDGMIADASAAVAALREGLPPGAPVALLGMCSGGNVALATAALSGEVAGVAAWSTYPFQEQRDGRQDVKRTGHFLKVYAAKALRLSTWWQLLRGGVHVGGVRRTLFGHYRKGEGSERDRQRSRRDVLGALGRYRGRVFFVYGGRDPEAPGAEAAFRAFFAGQGIPAGFHTVVGANHNFYSLAWKREAIEGTCAWLEGVLGDGAAQSASS
ncbi:MAG: alpha/beta fold hydrolase [Candidatus Brocadiaceae bacterium]|nr:alpha/beta fold hydrolase [Candidatus Brocadiaceae bacterium]